MRKKLVKNLKISLGLLLEIHRELSKARWQIVEMYAHDRAQGRKFDWMKLFKPQPSYYKIGIDLNLLQILMDLSAGND